MALVDKELKIKRQIDSEYIMKNYTAYRSLILNIQVPVHVHVSRYVF